MPDQMEPVWIYPSFDPKWHQKIVQEFKIHPVTAQILISRGFTTLENINNFLYGKLPNLFPPELLGGMPEATERIILALEKGESILIFGDNDVDGMTAAALLCEFFKQIGANVFYFIPQTFQQKKGLFAEALEYAIKNSCTLFITVDCGITAAKEIHDLSLHNIDVIVTDHHEPTARLPQCIAVNPKLENNIYPNRDLTGVGVAFKLAHALTNVLINQGTIKTSAIDLKQFLDLVALGTISDMGALTGENRILVRYGLLQLKKTKRIGLLKLFSVCDVTSSHLTPLIIASKIAPRLNSLGRIADPRKGVLLLLLRDEDEASALAQELDLNNLERQKIERFAAEDIEHYIETHPRMLKNKAIVLYSDKWHSGIIPILTSKICKLYNRPTMIISIENGIGKGSVRTIPEFPLLSTLKENRHLLLNFGGHDFAAGLTIEEKNIPLFKKNFIRIANAVLQDSDLVYKYYLDAPVNFADLTFDFMESLNLLEPFGNENPPPLLYCDVKQQWPPKVVGTHHLKFYFEQNDRVLEGIGFGMASKRGPLRRKGLSLRIAFTPHINTFLNKTSIQLQIKDFKIIEEKT